MLQYDAPASSVKRAIFRFHRFDIDLQLRPMSSSERKLSPAVLLATLGIAYGDIGTSPLYAFKKPDGGTAPASH